MWNLKQMIQKVREQGYAEADAEAKVCQDIVLHAISKSSLSRNVTIKGGVVMRSITNDIRRATQDLDIDFIRYSLEDKSIDFFIEKLNCIREIRIKRKGNIEELKQQDYHGKRIYIEIVDFSGNIIESKIDLGVHNKLEIEQEEYCFDIAYNEQGVSLLINSKEQMFTEKLRSLLKFGSFCTRYKDVYDMFYFCDKLEKDKLKNCFETYIFSDLGMKENTVTDILKRVESVFQDKRYRTRVDYSDKRWLDEKIEDIFSGILHLLESLI